MKRYSREDICNLPELNCGYVRYDELQAEIDTLEKENELLREIIEGCGVDADEMLTIKAEGE